MKASMNPNKRLLARILMHGAAFIASIGLLAIGLFIFGGPLNMIELNLSHKGALAWDAMLSALFFAQHSGMVRRSIQAAMAKHLPEYYHGALYAFASGIVLVIVVLLWQPSGSLLFELQGLGRWIARGLFVLAAAGMVWCASALKSFDPFGMGPIKAQMSIAPLSTQPFSVQGPYLWVRHPLYFFTLVMLWSCPDLSADRLLFNLLWSSWIYLGTVLEEKDLLSDFGDDYARYQRQVPMLIPWKKPKTNHP